MENSGGFRKPEGGKIRAEEEEKPKRIKSLLRKPIFEMGVEGRHEHEMVLSGDPHFFWFTVVLV